MIDDQDPGTIPMMFTMRRPRGRPRSDTALTPAERARRYRVRKSELAAPVDTDVVAKGTG